MRRTWRWIAMATLGAAVAGAYVPEAQACGGTFCDAGPQSMPVDQSGENILFVMEDGWVEAHVQIQYEGDPEQFAWIVPVMAQPTITPGSDLLFQNMLAATVPTFMLSTRFEGCGGDTPQLGCGAMMADDASLAAGGIGGDTDGGMDPDAPTVLDHGVAGAFEYAVLEGTTVDGVVQWLDDNGYAQDDDAPPILDEYLQEGFLFVAFKLVGGTGVEEIHPVVIRYQGEEPCVPIRLTRIAATPDMGIRTFFLGDARVVPTNYRAVEINPLLIDWVNLGANYEDLLTQAVDGPGSEGHGFVTEYAGASNIVTTMGLLDPQWDADRFRDILATQVVDELEAQGLVWCDPSIVDGCEYYHPLVEGLLQKFLPRPVGVTAEQFYSCVECYADLIDQEAWSAAGFADAMEERILGPAEHAVDILQGNPYLTRMYTTMSDHEMTADPLFHENASLPDVSNVYTATRVNNCEGPDFIELPDGRRLAIDPGGTTPTDMPTAAMVQEMPDAGAPMTLFDGTDDIEAAREDWNAMVGLDEPDSGCNCHSSRRDLSGAAWMALMLGFAFTASRRRR